MCRGDGVVCFWCALHADERTRGWVELEGCVVDAAFVVTLLVSGVPMRATPQAGLAGPPWLAKLWDTVRPSPWSTFVERSSRLEYLRQYGTGEERALEGGVLIRLLFGDFE